MAKTMMPVKAIIPDFDVTRPAARGGRRVLALALALLLPCALAACSEPEDEAAQPTGESGEIGEETDGEFSAAPGDDFPLDDLDSVEPELPVVIMPMDADGIPVMELAVEAPAENFPAELQPAAATTTRVRALDKITARVIELDLPQDMEVRFGTLAIRARTCRSRPPEEPPETFAFLEIDDVKMDEERERIFSGWMMASSPALNALEHPVYDVWVIACRMSSAGASSASE